MAKKVSDIYKVEIYIANLETLKKLLDKIHPEIAPKKAKQKDEQWVVESFIDETQIAWLKKNEFAYKIIENATEKGKERQKEVGKGNRYEKINVIPKGLGKKIK